MDTRRFGRTGHMSTVAIFGAFALFPYGSNDQDLAEATAPGGAAVLPHVLRACETFLAIDEEQQEALIALGANYDPLFQEVPS